MRYYDLEPEAPGGLGNRTVFDRSGPCLKITKLHYELDGWLGDDLLTSHPCFFATRRLADKIALNKLTGITLSDMETSRSITFEILHPRRQLPEFVWLKIDGEPGIDDFGIAGNGHLVISEKALTVLKSFNLNHCDIAPYPNSVQ
jgi:hypothetical protein